MPWLAAVPAVAGGLASAAGTTAAAAAPALASAAGSLGSALGTVGSAIGSGLGSAGSALGSAGGAIGGALSEIPGALSSFGGAVGDTLGSAGSSLLDAVPSFGGGGEAGVLEGLGQSVPQGVELVGPSTPLNGGLGTSMVEQATMFPQTMTPGTSSLAEGAALPSSFGGPSGVTQPANTGMLDSLMQSMTGAGQGQQSKDQGIMDAFSPGQMMQGILDPVSGFLQDRPGPQLQMPERRAPQTADFGMQDRLSSLVRAFQIQ